MHTKKLTLRQLIGKYKEIKCTQLVKKKEWSSKKLRHKKEYHNINMSVQSIPKTECNSYRYGPRQSRIENEKLMSLLIKSEIKKCHCILVITDVPSNEFSFPSRINVVKNLKSKNRTETRELWKEKRNDRELSPFTYTWRGRQRKITKNAETWLKLKEKNVK